MGKLTKVVPHVHREGSREHVPYWTGHIDRFGREFAERHCSHPHCELNHDAAALRKSQGEW